MSITYTNRKGITYTLIKTRTKAGSTRYVFQREPQGEPADTLPEGFVIRENIHGIVALVRDRPSVFDPAEIAAFQSVIDLHPKAYRYRIETRGAVIEIFEQRETDFEFLRTLGFGSIPQPELEAKLLAEERRNPKYSPVLRFTLVDAEKRRFSCERWFYSGAIVDQWLLVGRLGTAAELAEKTIPVLGTNEFYDL